MALEYIETLSFPDIRKYIKMFGKALLQHHAVAKRSVRLLVSLCTQEYTPTSTASAAGGVSAAGSDSAPATGGAGSGGGGAGDSSDLERMTSLNSMFGTAERGTGDRTGGKEEELSSKPTAEEFLHIFVDAPMWLQMYLEDPGTVPPPPLPLPSSSLYPSSSLVFALS
jgi:hypothetical protein